MHQLKSWKGTLIGVFFLSINAAKVSALIKSGFNSIKEFCKCTLFHPWNPRKLATNSLNSVTLESLKRTSILIDDEAIVSIVLK